MMSRKLLKAVLGGAVLGSAAVISALPSTATAKTADGKYLIYLSLSYSGNNWQDEAANIVKALAATPPYDKTVELKEVISGVDPQAQISAYESMIQAGADAIISWPIGPTALNRVIRQGCKQGVKFFMYDGTVTEPCAYNISYITSGPGENTAQYLVNVLDGKGKIFMARGVPGNSVDERHYRGAKYIFDQYPGIKVVDTYYGRWDNAVNQKETAAALAAHPDVDGIWPEDGEFGALQAMIDAKRIVPLVGGTTNGFRLALLNPNLVKKGLKGATSYSAPAQSGYTFKLMMQILTGKTKLAPGNYQYPLPWANQDELKMCKGGDFVDGCNTLPEGVVPNGFIDASLDSTFLPEINVQAVLTGKPVPGKTIQPLPEPLLGKAPNMPGLNCDKCKAEPAADMYKLTEVKPTVAPGK
ncbi:sugar ABC transporter substrate-binding protein [Castellaniella caeni]